MLLGVVKAQGPLITRCTDARSKLMVVRCVLTDCGEMYLMTWISLWSCACR